MTDYAKGDVLLSLRGDRRMSREAVAAELGVTAKTLYSWEKLNGAIRWENARSLASFYNVEPDSLVTRDQDEAAGLPSRDQLDRIEAKLDLILTALGVEDDDPGERFLSGVEKLRRAVQAASASQQRAAAKTAPNRTPRA